MAAAALLLGLCFGDLVHDAYVTGSPDAVRALVRYAETREDTLLLRYRLYALTQSPGLIAELPSDLDSATARELALLSALWGYRTSDARLLQLVVYGRRTLGLLNRALEQDPNDALVMLIDGQSLLFRPGIAGGSKERGLERLEALHRRVHTAPACGVAPLEADIWLWYALHRNDEPDAEALRRDLLERELPPLYREFLDAPP
jgi:hypothetical protein